MQATLSKRVVSIFIVLASLGTAAAAQSAKRHCQSAGGMLMTKPGRGR